MIAVRENILNKSLDNGSRGRTIQQRRGANEAQGRNDYRGTDGPYHEEVEGEREKIEVIMGMKEEDAIDVIRSRITTLQKRAGRPMRRQRRAIGRGRERKSRLEKG